MPLGRLAAAVIRLAVRLLRKMPRQVSVNFYETPAYCMVPHKDGYADQTCIVSLGSDSRLHFWRQPMSEEEKLGRAAFHTRDAGTAVYEERCSSTCGSPMSTAEAPEESGGADALAASPSGTSTTVPPL